VSRVTFPFANRPEQRIVSAAENSSLDWRPQFAYIEDIDGGRGYTAGVIGFCSGTGDMPEPSVWHGYEGMLGGDCAPRRAQSRN
jgi:hypothetical protein